jgi:hypothetical protein
MVRRLFVLLVPLVLLAGACSSDGGEKAAHVTTTSSSTTSSTSTSLGSSTTSAAGATSTTAPGQAPTSTTTPAGDGLKLTGPVGSGTVAWTASADRSELCYRITVRGIGAPSEASLRHTAGEAVLALQPPPADGTVNTCSASDALTIEELHTHPGNFLIQVSGPKGVLRATLR